MNKNRLEAFSDGVFAIVITLLILDVRIPKVDYSSLVQAMLDVVPKVLAYILSFIIVGIYWVSHHNTSHYVEKIDRTFVWLNVLLLLFVGFIPFPTSLLGQYPFGQIPVIFYGCILIATNAIGFGMWYYAQKKGLLKPNIGKNVIRGLNMSFIVVNSSYLLAILLSMFHVGLSYMIYTLVIIYVIFPKSWYKQ